MCNNSQSGQKWTFILYFLNHYEKTSTLIKFFPRQKAAMEIFCFHNRLLCKDVTLTAHYLLKVLRSKAGFLLYASQ